MRVQFDDERELDAKIEKSAIKSATTKPGIMIRKSETPADFILDNSYFSAISPKTITEEIKTVIGTAIGINVMA